MRPERFQETSMTSRRTVVSTLSTLAAGVKYEGNISGAGELQIDGSLKGDVRVARVTGSVSQTVIGGGRVRIGN